MEGFKLDGPDWNPVAEFDATDIAGAIAKLDTEPWGKYRIIEVATDTRVSREQRTVNVVEPYATPGFMR